MSEAAIALDRRSPIDRARDESLQRPPPRGWWALVGVTGIFAGLVGAAMVAVAGFAVLGQGRDMGEPFTRWGSDFGPAGWTGVALLALCLVAIIAFKLRRPAVGIDGQLRYRGSKAGAGYRARSEAPEWWPHMPIQEAKDFSVGPSVAVVGSWIGVGVASVLDGDESLVRCEFIAAGRQEHTARLPAMTLYSPAMPAHLVAIDERADIDVAAFDLLGAWTGKAADPQVARAALTPPVVRAMNSIDSLALAVSADASGVAIWVPSPDEDVDVRAVEELRRLLADALTQRDRGDSGRPREWTRGDDAWERAMREASVGELRARSRVRSRWSLLSGWALLAWVGWLTLAVGFWFVPIAAGWPAGAVVFGGWVAVAVPSWLAYRAASARVRALDDRHLRVALQVREVARARDWPFRRRDPSLETGWTAEVLAKVDLLGAMPAAQGEGTWGPAGVAYLEADRRIGPIAVSAFTSRMAWTRIPGGALRVAFIREDFSQKVAKLLGGEDVDVESHEFNQRWRVRADDPRDAHALLNPRVIEALLQIGDSHVAFTIAGDRAVLWDDGSEADVDLNARVSTLESLVGAIAPYLRGR